MTENYRPWFYSAHIMKGIVTCGYISGVITTNKTGGDLYNICVQAVIDTSASDIKLQPANVHVVALNRAD